MEKLLYIIPIVLLAIWEGLENNGHKKIAGLVKFVWLFSFLIFLNIETWLYTMAFYAIFFDPVHNIAFGQKPSYLGVTKIPDIWFRKWKVPGGYLLFVRVVAGIGLIGTIIYNNV